MTHIKKVDKIEQNYPIKTIEDVVNLFKRELELEDGEPNLTLLSLVVGTIENFLASDQVKDEFPIIKFDDINSLYKKFQQLLTLIENNQAGAGEKVTQYATRELIKRVSDVIWNSLLRFNKKSDRAHLQSLYTFLNGNKLDCFGTAFATVAGCQILGYKDVHLAISEDHVWVVFGATGEETIEVTWHGKVFEDKRGSSVIPGIEMQTWKYLGNALKTHAVICDRQMEVAAIVSSINPSLSTTTTCVELQMLQQQLLWLLYDKGILKAYPMGLGCLGELEEVAPTPGRQTCEELYQESILSARRYYRNQHVYPYCYISSYYYRKNNHKMALKSWADAADVIRMYNYHRDDEEIYKEFHDIANETIPSIMKAESSGHSAHSIVRSAESFGDLLRFYDGICQWEEGSLTPILHIGWAKPLVNNISKYEYDVRAQLLIKCGEIDDLQREIEKIVDDSSASSKETSPSHYNNNNNNNNNIDKTEKSNADSKLSSIVAACGEKILNPDFLWSGGGKLFTDDKKEGEASKVEPTVVAEVNNKKQTDQPPKAPAVVTPDTKQSKDEEYKQKQPEVILYSQKMKGLKEILVAEKLNTNAISLQITAQSQVSGRKSRMGGGIYGTEFDTNSRAKRVRRD